MHFCSNPQGRLLHGVVYSELYRVNIHASLVRSIKSGKLMNLMYIINMSLTDGFRRSVHVFRLKHLTDNIIIQEQITGQYLITYRTKTERNKTKKSRR